MAAGILTGVAGAVINAALPELGAMLPSITETAKVLVERLVPDQAAREQAQRELEQVLTQRETALASTFAEVAKAQIAVNATEAQSTSLFVAGWRPFVGWVAGAGLAGGLIFQPLLAWFTGIVSVAIGAALPPPPSIDLVQVIGLLASLLGFAGYRTYEKVQGVPDSPVTLSRRR